ncbi:MAG TPA: hypothetical protein VN253_29300 [Kofleriaceae bacterium]|nr:hypothetical protein [Kofleriaceae bacterium]
MRRIALLVVVLAAGCSNKKPEERKLVGSGAPVPSSPSGSTAGSAPAGSAPTGSAAPAGSAPAASSAAGSATAEAKGTGFAPFDDAMAGIKPWVTADDKAGVVELYAAQGKLTVERTCGPDAGKVIEAMGKRMAERTKDGHDAPKCKEDAGGMSCFQPGTGESDVSLEIQYAKTGDAWRPIGAKTYGVGVHADKEEAKYAALLKEKCK